MPSRRIEVQLEALNKIRGAGKSPEAISALRVALKDSTNVVVAKAANVTAELEMKSLIPELLSAFDRLFENVRESDPQCWGKNALSKALASLEYNESAPFRRGAKHVQLEPVWGGQEDTAATLRGTCLFALVQCLDVDRKDVFRLAVNALSDPIVTVRVDAARILEQLGGEEAVLLLRLKARTGDRETQVIGQALESLLKLEGSPAVEFVDEFLHSEDEAIFEETALALGASNLVAALDCLIECWQNQRAMHDPGVILRAVALSRQEGSLDFLLRIIREGREREVLTAIKALAIRRESPELRARVADAAHLRAERAIHEFFYQEFGNAES